MEIKSGADIKNIIDKINSKNKTELFDSKQIPALEKYLMSLGKLTYIGHGGLAVCFSKTKGEIIKCCRKGRGTIVLSKELFMTTYQKLIDNEMNILPAIDVLYEDNYWFVYTQPACDKIITATDISPKICYEVIKFVDLMIKKNIKISDIFYRNFGIYQGKLYLFDYHEVESFESSSGFLVTNLYSLFTYLGKGLGWPVIDMGPTNTTFVTYDNYGESRFPEVVVKLLQALHSKQYTLALEHLNGTLKLLCEMIPKKFTGYQKINIDENAIIGLSSHTLTKYQLAEEIVKSKNITTVLDSRCNKGGIGLKLAQTYPKLHVSFGSPDMSELSKAKSLANHCMVYNVSFIPSVVKDGIVTISSKQKYDLVLYYSIFHHLLKVYSIKELIEMIKMQATKYCIIEIPILGDSLLDQVMKTTKNVDNFKCLTSPETFRYYLILYGLKVNKCIRVNYDKKRLIRYAYVCGI